MAEQKYHKLLLGKQQIFIILETLGERYGIDFNELMDVIMNDENFFYIELKKRVPS